ncbi:MAG TPA: hypothetical protein VGK71_05945 [Nitrospirota bacterium]
MRKVVKVENGQAFIEFTRKGKEPEVDVFPPASIYGFTPIAMPDHKVEELRAAGYKTAEDMKAETMKVIEADKAKGCRFALPLFPLTCGLIDGPCEWSGQIENCAMEADLFCSGCGNSAPGWNTMSQTVTPCDCGGRFIPAGNTLMISVCSVCGEHVERLCSDGSPDHCGKMLLTTETKEKITAVLA